MRAQFPKLAIALGDNLFEAVLATYLECEPRVSIRDSGTKLPDFLADTADYPMWYAELAMLDRAHVDVVHAPVATTLARRDLTLDRMLRIVPAHALVQLTTSVDELWSALEHRKAMMRPRELDWPRTVLVWRTSELAIQSRSIEAEEANALWAVAHGTTLTQLSRMFAGENPHARALDAVLRWIDAGVLAR